MYTSDNQCTQLIVQIMYYYILFKNVVKIVDPWLMAYTYVKMRYIKKILVMYTSGSQCTLMYAII